MKALMTAGLCLIAVSASAQTVTRALEWNHLASALSDVQAATFTLTIDQAKPVAVTATCVTQGADVHCATPITLTPGSHTVTLTATTAGGSGSGTVNYVPPPVLTPSGLTITIKITVP